MPQRDTSNQYRLVLLISILASFVAFLDGSVVNVALPAITRELGGGFAIQQWIVDAYLITLGSLILVAGSLSDLFGRGRVLAAGLAGFLIASLLCACAPTAEFLIFSRTLQGIAGALLVPSSLALIIATFKNSSQGKAIGSWTAWTGISFIIGPLVGGFLVDTASWRLVFAINVLPIVLTLWLLRRLEHTHGSTHAKVDIIGATLGVIGLGGSVYALIEQPRFGWSAPEIWVPLSLAVLALSCFIWYEARAAAPMLPLSMFRLRNFFVGNVATLTIYGGLSVSIFLLIIFLQQVGNYSALRAGLSVLPVTIIMFLLSPRFGVLAGTYGPRLFMGVGPLIAGSGFLLMVRVSQPVDYWTTLLPALIVFGIGMSMTAAPLTAAILGCVAPTRAGIASAVNNAIARIAGLITVAMIGIVTGTQLDLRGFHRAVLVTALLVMAGGVISLIGITNRQIATP